MKVIETRDERTNSVVSAHVGYNPGLTATEDDERLEILDFESR